LREAVIRLWLTRRRRQLLAGECPPVEDHELVHAAQAVAEGCLAWAPGGRALDLPSQDSEVAGDTLRLRYCARLLANSELPSRRRRDCGPYFMARERFESDLIASVVEKHAGNKEKAARELGISLSTTNEKLRAAC
jgi:DNA-binding NtrC family response regulator